MANQLSCNPPLKEYPSFLISVLTLRRKGGAGAAITLADMRQLNSELSVGRKPSTDNDVIFKALAVLFRMAVEDEIIEKSPPGAA